MQPPLKRLSTGTGQQEGQRMQDVDENFGRVEQAIDTLNANASLSRGMLASCDLNTVKTPGSYYLSTSQTYTNTPPGVNSGFLDVISAGGLQTAQRVIAWSNSYERISTSTQWSNWR
jgi:hypothetical protein